MNDTVGNCRYGTLSTLAKHSALWTVKIFSYARFRILINNIGSWLMCRMGECELSEGGRRRHFARGRENPLRLDQGGKTRQNPGKAQLIPSVGLDQKSWLYTTFTMLEYSVRWHDFCPIPTGSAVCICLNSLVVHSASYSMYTRYTLYLRSTKPTYHVSFLKLPFRTVWLV